MRQAVIVSYARTGLAKATRGGFNNTPAMTMLGHAIEHAVQRAKVEPQEVEDVVAGSVAAHGNVARAAALLAGLPVTTSGVSLHRACSSGIARLGARSHSTRHAIRQTIRRAAMDAGERLQRDVVGDIAHPEEPVRPGRC